MAEIIKRSHIVETTDCSLVFEYADDPNAGFSFTCDEDGNVDASTLQPAGYANLVVCLTGNVGRHTVIAKGVVKTVRSYRESSLLRCDCGDELYLHDPLDNLCTCGRCYNMSGQKVLPSWHPDIEEPLDPEPGVGSWWSDDGYYNI
jgi:hypothetical protein